jgi:hypothetical protein
MISKEQFKDLFLKLTEYTIPFGYEEVLEKYLPKGYTKDSIGNYFYEIGNSETLFTTHLDTFSEEYVKVNQVVKGDWVATDGTTILGGDNKLGTAILINMVNEKIPGTYYFFIGEEPLESGGLYGSRKALASNPQFFKKFKRAIAFDRREYGSIVTRQKARMCCSMEFATEIAKNLKKYSGIDWDKKGGYGYYTDTATFLDVIPEITNLSVGGYREHHEDEHVNLAYTYAVLHFALNMDWESLPVVRELEVEEESSLKMKNFLLFSQKKLIEKITDVMDVIDLTLTKKKVVDNVIELTFSKWLEDYDYKIFVDGGGKIIIEDTKLNFDYFINYILKENWREILTAYKYYSKENPKEAESMIKKLGFNNESEFFKRFKFKK